ncbi:beta-1,2-xylosyltransferase XYXT1-like isoform X2 [Phragmites australis]|uniref:beta-1,2-xylosyltransferase XYXT1-like isoform X2 n=1 Tax=Phragmites australis TaxID=29695 RepID=UPI002D76FD2B|nr:beta-1,2-xylosyltransferase XYXT1-like isoform X2 [Phragmites australis]
MGSPKAAKSMVKQGIWRHRVGAPFAAVLVAAVLAVVVFSGQFAQGPNASSQFTTVLLDDTLRPVRDKLDSTEIGGSPNKEDLATVTSDQELDAGNPEPKQASQGTTPAVGEGGTVTGVPTQKGERSTGGSEPLEKESPLLDQEGEEATAKSGSVPYTKCTPPTGATLCDLSNQRFDICELCGDARTIGQSSTVMYVPQSLTSNGEEWSIRAQSRKNLPWIKEVTVKSLNSSQPKPSCTSRHAMPAIVFALGGLTANVWHDFSDVLVPLFLTARQFNREVQLLITNNQPWFIKKYSAMFNHLTRHNIIDFDADDQVRCYPHVIVGLRSHRDLGIDPNSSPQNFTMMDFRLFVREAYGLPAPEVDIPYRADKDDPDKKPRIMLIDRGKTRRFVNAPDVVQGLDWFGFEVVKADLTIDSNLDEFVHLVDSCDAIMGVHGAGLTNMVFLRSGAVLVHIVPYGIEFMADGFYGAPARDMGLRHVQYSISPGESTLLEKYGWNHTVIKDPEAIRNSGWEKVGELYMSKQDIVLNMTRFGPSLMKAMEFVI